MMPEMDGFEFLAEMRKSEQWRTIPVIVLTAMDLGNAERDRLKGQVAAILQKGATTQDELLKEVQTLVSGVSKNRKGVKVG